MPDEIGWIDPEDEAILDRAGRAANARHPETPAEAAEVVRRCAAAEAYRKRREAARKGLPRD